MRGLFSLLLLSCVKHRSSEEMRDLMLHINSASAECQFTLDVQTLPLTQLNTLGRTAVGVCYLTYKVELPTDKRLIACPTTDQSCTVQNYGQYVPDRSRCCDLGIYE